METFFAIGYRHRTRDYTTFGTDYNMGTYFVADGSSKHLEEDYSAIMVGFKIGINKFF